MLLLTMPLLTMALCEPQLFGLWYAVGRDRIELRFIEALVSHTCLEP